jgi:hypothetical protein
MNTIYFVQKTSGPIKIGISRNVSTRIAALKTSSDEPLTLLATVNGNSDAERYFHSRLTKHRLYGEWYFPHREVLDVVEEVIRDGKFSLPSHCHSEPEVVRIAEKQRKKDIVLICQAYVDGIAAPIACDETQEDVLRRVASLTGLPYRTIKSIRYSEKTGISAFQLLTLRMHFTRRIKEYAATLDAARALRPD